MATGGIEQGRCTALATPLQGIFTGDSGNRDVRLCNPYAQGHGRHRQGVTGRPGLEIGFARRVQQASPDPMTDMGSGAAVGARMAPPQGSRWRGGWTPRKVLTGIVRGVFGGRRGAESPLALRRVDSGPVTGPASRHMIDAHARAADVPLSDALQPFEMSSMRRRGRVMGQPRSVEEPTGGKPGDAGPPPCPNRMD